MLTDHELPSKAGMTTDSLLNISSPRTIEPMVCIDSCLAVHVSMWSSLSPHATNKGSYSHILWAINADADTCENIGALIISTLGVDSQIR